jgi:hypothetical protein
LVATAVLGGLGVSACGGGASQAANEPSGNFPVRVSQASFPPRQTLSEHTHMVIAVRNTGTATIPDVAVTVTTDSYGTAAQSFGTLIASPPPGQPILASRSRPVWIVDQPPGQCAYSCQQGGPGGAVTADSDTWALGKLGPGQTVKFDWGVTAVQPGSYRIHYVVAAGLAGKAKAVLAGGRGRVQGSFQVKISSKPRQAYVNNDGKVVNTG